MKCSTKAELATQDKRLKEAKEKGVFQYVKYNVNPKGLFTGDCTVRALAYGTGESWESTIRQMTEMSIRTGKMMYYLDGENEYMQEKGWNKIPQPRHSDGTLYTIKEFAEKEADPNKRYVIRVSRHLSCLDGRVLVDIWNCSTKKIRTIWVK